MRSRGRGLDTTMKGIFKLPTDREVTTSFGESVTFEVGTRCRPEWMQKLLFIQN